MKNKLQLVDLGGMSSYVGRISTIVIALGVIALTISALFSNNKVRGSQRLTVWIAADPSGPVPGWEDPFERILSSVTGRVVTVTNAMDAAPSEWELVVMPAVVFLERENELDATPLFSLEPRTRPDRALLVAAGGFNGFENIVVDDVLFSSPVSPNGCWQQLSALDQRGVRLPDTMDGLRFAAERVGPRVVAQVVFGRYKLGACRASDVDRAVEDGVLRRNELSVVLESPALPELILACRKNDEAYFRRVLGNLPAVTNVGSQGSQQTTAALLRERGIGRVVPVTHHAVERADSLHRYVVARFGLETP